jgi:hypothetical protein
MTLPQETIEKITKDAEVKTEAKAKEIIGQFMPRSTNYIAFLDGYEEGRIDGATEWAGKAQGLVDALEFCAKPMQHGDANLALYTRQELAQRAIAKYKEVGNEK